MDRIITRIQLVLMMLIGGLLAEEVRLSAAVDRERINLDEVITYTIRMEGLREFPELEPPRSDGFIVISGPSQSSSFQVVNGAVSSSKTLQWRLAPIQTGRLTIPALEIKVGRKTYRTEPIEVLVAERPGSAQKATPSRGSPPPDRPAPSTAQRGELLLVAEVPKTTLYKGEELLVTFNLYFKTSPKSYVQQKLPDAKGFWTEQFPEKRNPPISSVIIDGIAYKKATLRRLALFPTTTGELVIDPLQITCEMPATGQRRRSVFDDFFDDSFFSDPFFGRTVTVPVQSEPVKILVRELPSAGQPRGFNGAVGNFVIESRLDTLETRQNQALTLRYTISGSGNISAVKLPPLELPASVEIFEPQIERTINNQGKSIRGAVHYEYVLIPRSSGRLQIPALNFAYFDPHQERYQVSTARGYSVTVKPLDQGGIAGKAGFRKEEVSLLGSDIRFIMRSPPRWRPANDVVFRRGWFWLLNLISLSLILGSYAYRRWLEKVAGDSLYTRRRKALTRAQQRLQAAAASLASDADEEMVGLLNRALAGLIADRLGLASSGLGPRDFKKALDARGLDQALVTATVGQLEELERLRFLPAGFKRADAQALYERVSHLIQKLRKVI